MKSLIFGAVASLALSTALLVAPASAAPIPSAGGTLATASDVTTVQMMMHDRMERRMMRHHMMKRHMMMRERMMMRRHMMHKRMMHGM